MGIKYSCGGISVHPHFLIDTCAFKSCLGFRSQSPKNTKNRTSHWTFPLQTLLLQVGKVLNWYNGAFSFGPARGLAVCLISLLDVCSYACVVHWFIYLLNTVSFWYLFIDLFIIYRLDDMISPVSVLDRVFDSRRVSFRLKIDSHKNSRLETDLQMTWPSGSIPRRLMWHCLKVVSSRERIHIPRQEVRKIIDSKWRLERVS